MNRILFLTTSLSGGVGRVTNLLNNAISGKGFDVRTIEIGCVPEKGHCLYRKILMLFAAFYSRVLKNSDKAAVLKFKSHRLSKYLYLKRKLKGEESTVISFLNEPVFLSLLCRKSIKHLIISERNDPSQFAGNRTTMAFIKYMYQKADVMVCQSPDAKSWYDENSEVKSVVIYNPVKPDLPAPYRGKRRRRIVNFCRISTQKNLPLLVEAFSILNKAHPDYELFIYGDEEGNGAEGTLEALRESIVSLGLNEQVHILPGDTSIHSKIHDYAMFVSSSDFEGMSNSMLEAMAIGLPTICTDCPAGGARAVIKDHENGLLVPVGDADALANAMIEVIENPELAEKLSRNGSKIRETQSVDKIVDQWLEVING